MSLSINAAQLADTGFVLFVIFTCGYSLFSNKEQGASKSKRWMQELGVIQESIRELIGEASSASSHLDRTLQRRKLELERLLSKLDTTPRQIVDELPNESWEEKPITRNTRPQTEREIHIQKRNVPQQPRPKSPLRNNSELARRIEVFLEDKKPSRMVAEEGTDPAAYKIAKRLLKDGKEIHLVAKKVGLPIEEIRVLDSMVNGESAPLENTHVVRAIEPEVVSPPTTYSRAKQIVQRLEEPTQDIYIGDDENLSGNSSNIKRATTYL